MKGVLIVMAIAIVALVVFPLVRPFFEKFLALDVRPSQIFVSNVTEYPEEGEPPAGSAPVSPVFVEPTPTPSPTPSVYQQKAEDLLDQYGNLFSSGSSSCGLDAGPLQNLQDAAAGRAPQVCGPTVPCTCRPGGTSGQVTLSERLIDALTSLSRQFGNRITVTSLTGGIHGANSGHYNGTAADIIYNSGGATQWNDLLAKVWAAGATRAVCEAKINGKSVYLNDCNFINTGCYTPSSGGNVCGTFTNIHIHAVFPAGRILEE